MHSLFGAGKTRDMRSEAGGAVMVEFLIAYLPVLVSFLMFWQLGELLLGQMVVERASSAAGRAAVVVLPDDPAFYDAQDKDLYEGERKREIRLAAGMMLAASPHLSENFTVDVSNIPAHDDTVSEITVRVQAEFRCKRLTWVCGLDGLTVLTSESQHTYHGAGYDYEPTDLSAVGQNNTNTADPGCSDSDTPNAGGANGGHGGNGGRNSGGHGGQDQDQSGSCPPGQTANKDGTCGTPRGGGGGGGKCKKGTPDPNGVCSDGTCADTGKRPKDPHAVDPCPDPDTQCQFPGGGKAEPPKGGVCPADMFAGDGKCFSRSNKRDSNGCFKYNAECTAQVKASGTHHLTGTYTPKTGGGDSVNFTSFPGFKSCGQAKASPAPGKTDSCSSGGSSQSGKNLGDEIINSIYLDVFKSQCRDNQNGLNNAQRDRATLSVANQSFVDKWQAYCDSVKKYVSADGSTTVSDVALADLSDVKSAGSALVDAWKAVPSSDQAVWKGKLNGSNGVHTETKIVNFLKDWSTKPGNVLDGGQLNVSGEASPCDKCDEDLSAFSSKYNVPIHYCFDYIYPSGPVKKESSQFLVGGASLANCGIGVSACIDYDSGQSSISNPPSGTSKLCKAGADSCK